MIYLLDTNACIIYLKRPDFPIRQRLQELPPTEIAVCMAAPRYAIGGEGRVILRCN